MALSGTLETFSLPDVLRLLASTKKTGRLALDGDRGTGEVWVDGGDISAAGAARAVVDDVDAVLFELLRFTDAAFEFDASATPPASDVRRPVEDALEVAGTRLDEWREIEAVVPSLDVRIRMVPEVDGDTTVTPDVWRVLACVGTGASGHAVARQLEQGEFEVCRGLRDLIESGLVELTEALPEVVPATEAVAEAFATMVHAPAPELVPVYEVPEAPADPSPLDADETDDDRTDAAEHAAAVEEHAEAVDPVDPVEEPRSELALLSPRAAAAVEATWSDDATDAPEPVPAPDPALEADQDRDDDADQNLLLKFLSSAKH